MDVGQIKFRRRFKNGKMGAKQSLSHSHSTARGGGRTENPREKIVDLVHTAP